MKKYLLILATIINFGNLKANSDSLTYKTDSICSTNFIEPIVIKDSSSEECLILELNQTEKNEHNNIKIKNNLKHISKPANWFTDAWDAFTDLFKPVWGHYTEDGFRNEGPYFLFDRKLEGPTYVQIQMQQVQDKIK